MWLYFQNTILFITGIFIITAVDEPTDRSLYMTMTGQNKPAKKDSAFCLLIIEFILLLTPKYLLRIFGVAENFDDSGCRRPLCALLYTQTIFYLILCYAMIWDFTSCWVMSQLYVIYAIPCYILSWYGMLWFRVHHVIILMT